MMDRRNLLALMTTGLTGFAVAPPVLRFPAPARAAETSPPPTTLKAVKRTLDIKGKSASVYGLIRDDGGHGLILEPGRSFNVALTNQLSEPTLIHWHGLTPPWPMDGVPDKPAPLMKPGETRTYAFPVADSGTYWMHAHTLQEQNLLAAPLMVHSASDAGKDEQEVVVLLHDFSFTPAEQLLARLKKAARSTGMDMSGMNMAGMNHADKMKHMAQMAKMMGVKGRMDLNDIDYDAYLANDRTLDDPEVTQVEANGRVRLRIINGAAATAFTIYTGQLRGELVAVDGQDIMPVEGSQFPMAMGQRLDIRLAIPRDGGAFPILALREGAPEQAGIVLASAKANVGKIGPVGSRKGPIVTLELESHLVAARPLPSRNPDRSYNVALIGNMATYSWGIDGGDALKVKTGERVEITISNMSMMTHPMHLHGHHFQVVAIGGHTFRGALRDTVAVPPMASVTIAFDAANPGKWAFHCHHLYHMESGMMSFVAYEGTA
jgi:FtsP/CotA-like multicopper oxidase with cupredoxin domain